MIEFYARETLTGKVIKGSLAWEDTEIKVVDSNLSTANFEPGKIGDQILDIVGDASSNPENERGFFEIENEHEHWDCQWESL
jgi:hypothetical protein